MLPWTHRSPRPKRHLDRFSLFCTSYCRESLYFTVPLLFPSKLPLHSRIWTPSNTRCLGLIRVHNPNNISIALAVFAWLTIVTDRPTYSVCNNGPHHYGFLRKFTKRENWTSLINGKKVGFCICLFYCCCFLFMCAACFLPLHVTWNKDE